jgi:type IV pilus assembly protein PilQ
MQRRAQVRALWVRGVVVGACGVLLGLGQPSPLAAQGRVSLDARQADVRAILSRIAEAGGLNVVLGPTVTGTVTLRLTEAPVEDALQIVLQTAGLVQIREGTTVGILSREAWLRQQRHVAAQQTLGMGPTRTAIVPLHYANAAELAPLLATLLSPWGAIAVDERTNSLIIRDMPESPLFQRHRVRP